MNYKLNNGKLTLEVSSSGGEMQNTCGREIRRIGAGAR